MLWTLAIAIACAWPGTDLPDPPGTFPLDKLAHAGLFAGFGLLWMGALRGSMHRRSGRVLTLGLLYAAATEGTQALLPTGRTASLLDLLADAAGLLIAVGVFFASPRLRRMMQPPPASEQATQT